tara:strand:- start:4232 stop:4642 length:411 start_codon:yes stop_codon:yes gene_type:complete
MARLETDALATGADSPYWDGLLAGELRLQQCAGCQSWHWPAVWRCSDCGSWDHVWSHVEPAGTIYSWTRTWHGFGGLEGISKPFVIAVVELADAGGVRLIGILDAPGEIHIGQDVSGTITTTPYGSNEVPAIRWRT